MEVANSEKKTLSLEEREVVEAAKQTIAVSRGCPRLIPLLYASGYGSLEVGWPWRDRW